MTIDEIMKPRKGEWIFCDPRRRNCLITHNAAEAGGLAYRAPAGKVLHQGRDATREALAKFRSWARRRRAELLAIDSELDTIREYMADGWLLDIPPSQLEG